MIKELLVKLATCGKLPVNMCKWSLSLPRTMDVSSVPWDEGCMRDKQDDYRFAFYTLFVGTVEKVDARRAYTNIWMLILNSVIILAYGFLYVDGSFDGTEAPKGMWLWAIPIAGILVSVSWIVFIASSGALIRAKFKVLKEIEGESNSSPSPCREQAKNFDDRMFPSIIKNFIPWAFVALYIAITIAGIGM